MRFGKIEYINLLPFHVFLKKQPLPSSFKKFAFTKKNYPSAINSLYKRKKIDAAFISSIAAKGEKRCLDIGIVAKREIQSVLVESDKKQQTDYQSATSNVLAKILKIEGKVSIGDKALKIYLERGEKNIKDLGFLWNQKYALPFVFASLCCNRDYEFYKILAKNFVKSKTKIPSYILKKEAKEKGIPAKDITKYLEKVSYKIDKKGKKALKKFYALSKTIS